MLITGAAFASDGRATATLTVRSAERSAIVVVVDDKRYDLGSNAVSITGLDACQHTVTVYQEDPAGEVSCFQKNYDVVFKSDVSLQPRTNLQISIDDCGIVTMNETRSRNARLEDSWQPSEYVKDDAAGYSDVMSSNEFGRVIWAISRESSENNRLRSAKQIINTNYFSTMQVKQLMDLFCSDDAKLQLAKLAYTRTVDPSGYYVLDNSFRSDDSRHAFEDCIRHW